MLRLIALMATLAAPALAQPMPGMPMPGMPAPAPAASPSAQAFKDADDRMMTGMARPITGDTDRDFVAGMVPHHQGAIDMAQIELRYGHDPVLRRLAARIVAAQDQEIALMRAWQRRHPAHP